MANSESTDKSMPNEVFQYTIFSDERKESDLNHLFEESTRRVDMPAYGYTIVYKCLTSTCILYGIFGTLTRCIGCGHYHKMVKLYKPDPPEV